MATYELSFELPAITDEVEDLLADQLDGLVAGHSGVITVTVLRDGDTCLQAALSALEDLRGVGANPERMVDDLVSRREIARRAGVTPQAVGNWIRGDRQTYKPFPKPFVLSSSELWLWGEVVDALGTRGIDTDSGVSFPSRRDIQLVGGAMAARAGAIGAGWASHGSVRPQSVVTGSRPKGQVSINTNRTDFALAS
jgi:hypothetical protein